MNPKILGIIAGIALAVVLLWPTGSSQKVEDLYNEAEALRQAGNYAEAIAKYEEALQEAEKPLVDTKVIDEDFQTLAKYRIAVCYANWAEQGGDVSLYDKAEEIIKEIYQTATVPKHREGIIYLWGHILFRQDRYEEARPKFQELIDNYPNSIFVENAWYALGKLNFQIEDYEQARLAFRHILDDFPNSQYKDDAQQLIAQSFLKEENYEQARIEFDRLSSEEFRVYKELQPEARYKAAYCERMLGNDQAAIDRYNSFIAEYPESQFVTAAYFDLGAIYAKQKDYDNARQNYQLALENTDNPQLKAEIQNEIARVYFDEGDYQNAIVAYQTLINDYPESPHIPEAKIGIGDSYFKLESWNEAIAAYKRFLDEHSDPPEYVPYAIFQIGEAYYQLGKSTEDQNAFAEALKWYQRVLDEYPEDQFAPHALYGAIWTLSEMGRNDEVQRIGKEFVDKRKNDENFALQAAEVQTKLGDIQFQIANEAWDNAEYAKARQHYEMAAQEYAKVWTDYMDLPQFYPLKLSAKFQEGLCYYNIAKPDGYQDTDKNAQFNTAYLQKSVAAYQQAIDRFLTNFDMSQDFPERLQLVESCLLNQALTYERLKEWEKARAVYALFQPGFENYERVQLLVAETYVQEGNPSAGVEKYRQVLADPNYSADTKSLAEIKLADLLRNEKRYEEAAQQYESVVARNPQGEFADDAQYLVGLCYYSIGEPGKKSPEFMQKAIEAFQKVVDNYPESPNVIEAYFGQILAYKELASQDPTNWAKVIELADAVNARFGDSEDAKIRTRLAEIEVRRIEAMEATEDSTKVADALIAGLRKVVGTPTIAEDSRAVAQLKIGHILFEAQRYDEAIQEYNKLIQSFPNNENVPIAHYQIAVCEFKLGEAASDPAQKTQHYRNAVQAATEALKGKLDADMSVSVYYTQGLAYFRMKDVPSAIRAFQRVVSFEDQITKEDRKPIVYQAHTQLAEMYASQGKYPEAIREYQYLIANSQDARTLGASYFAIAYAYDDKLRNYDEAVKYYQKAIEVSEDELTRAQSYYRMGLVYQNNLNDMQKALEAFNNLIEEYPNSQNSTVRDMVADAMVRRSDLLVKMGNLDQAIANAAEARDKALADPNLPLIQKLQAQYQYAYLLALRTDQIRQTLQNNRPTEEYKTAVRETAAAYARIRELAEPLDQLEQQARVFVMNALFQAGQLYYFLRFQSDLQNAVPLLEEFVKLADQGYFKGVASAADLQKNVRDALTYIGSAYFELARMAELDPVLFSQAAETFKDLVRRFPNDPDAPLWQYQAGESYYAAQDYTTAIAEYEKVRQLNPNHESAADSLYAMATCYQLLADAAESQGKVKERDANLAKVYELNEILATEYPDSQYAPDAFINVGNNYFNQTMNPDLSQEEREQLYRKALEAYKRAYDLPGIKPESKRLAKQYITETMDLLTREIYMRGKELIDQAKQLPKEAQEQKLKDAIKIFEDLIQQFPEAPLADISYVQIAEAYVIMEQWQKAMDAYKVLLDKYPINRPAADDQVQQARDYAEKRYTEIFVYLQQLKAQEGG